MACRPGGAASGVAGGMQQTPPRPVESRRGRGDFDPTGPCLYSLSRVAPNEQMGDGGGVAYTPLLCRQMSYTVECHVATAFVVRGRGAAGTGLLRVLRLG